MATGPRLDRPNPIVFAEETIVLGSGYKNDVSTLGRKQFEPRNMQVKALILISLGLLALVRAADEEVHPATEVKRCESRQLKYFGESIN